MQSLTRQLVVILATGTLSVAACTSSTTTSGRKLVIAEGTQPIAAPIYIANAKGYFKEEGVDVELVSFPTGKLCLDALIGGKADFATAAETPIMHASFTNQPVRIVATFHRATENTYIVARKDRGISAPVDLRGKTVGVPFGTNAEYALAAFLSKNGLKPTDLNLINLSPPEMIGPISKGDVAAVAAWEPHAARSQKALDDNAVRFSFAQVYEETYNLVSSPTMAKDNMDSIVKVLRALNRAVAFIPANRAESIEIVAKRIGMETTELDRVWPVYHFGLDLRTSLLDLLTSEGKWAVERGHQNGKVPDMRNLISTSALRAVRPESVELP